MKPRLKEEPKEWLKFTAVMAVVAGALAVSLHWKKVIPRPALVGALVLLVAVLLLCWSRPRLFRGFYRGGMTASFHVGQVMGRVLLTIFFLLVLTPLGLLLRLMGKDLLKLKRPANAATYWTDARSNQHFDRQF